MPRPVSLVPQWDLDDTINVTLFAGLGGACAGLEEAGLPIHVANNHDPVALAAHAALHPYTSHVRGSIFDVDPLVATGGRRVGVLWASPDCKFFSRARGDAPVSPRVRSLPWQVCRWAAKTRPVVIFFENVAEISSWSPLIAKRCKISGRVLKLDGAVAEPGEHVPRRAQQLVPDPRRKGETYRRWMRHNRALGYECETRVLNCADYGVPTSRRRLFGIMRRDGEPIRWPDRTHAPRGQAEALGLLPWVPASSIIDWSLRMPSIFERKQPLVGATMRRLATGLKRFVLDAPRPFLISQDACVGKDAAASFVHAYCGQKRNGESCSRNAAKSVATLSTCNRMAVIGAFLAQAGYGERAGQTPRALDVTAPLGTQVTHGGKHAVCGAWMIQHNGGEIGQEAERPLSTLTTSGTQQQVGAAYLAKLRGTSIAQGAHDPVPTLTAGGNHVAAVAAFLSKFYGRGTGQDCAGPLHTASTKDRFGVVAVQLAGHPYVVVDVGMRMLQPREAAAAHELRLPEVIEVGGVRRPLTKQEAMRLVGNSVPKRMARLIARANRVDALRNADNKMAAD